MTDQPDHHSFTSSFDPAMLTGAFDGDLGAGINACVECLRSPHRIESCHPPLGRGVGRTSGRSDLRGAPGPLSASREPARRPRRAAGRLRVRPAPASARAGRAHGHRVCLRAGAVYQPLFTAFGAAAIEQRLGTFAGQGRGQRRREPVEARRPDRSAPIILTIGGDGEGDAGLRHRGARPPGRPSFEPVMRTGDDPLLMMSTSGTTGPPKGVRVPMRALTGISAYMQYGLDVRDDDVFWNIADPGWAYGLYYAVIGPLLLGHQTTLYDGGFTVESTVSLIDELEVTNLAGAPTAYRMMIAAGPQCGRPARWPAPRRVERRRAAQPRDHALVRRARALPDPRPVRPDRVRHGARQSPRTGATPCIRGPPGSPMPGFSLAVVDDAGQPASGRGTEGVLAVRARRVPAVLLRRLQGRRGRGLGQRALPDRRHRRGERGRLDQFRRTLRRRHLVGRLSHRSVRRREQHCSNMPAVAESAVVGKPDEQRGEIVKAFVVLHAGPHRRRGTAGTELTDHVRNGLGKHAFPREIDVRRFPAQDAERQDPAVHPAQGSLSRARAAQRRAVSVAIARSAASAPAR